MSLVTGALEDARVTVAVSLSKSLHHSINLLGFTRQTKTPQELSAENRSKFRFRLMKNTFCNECRDVH